MQDFGPEPTPKQIEQLTRRISKELRGKGPMLQGAALADVVAMYFAGHHPLIRQEQIELWVKVMRDLIPPNEAALFKHYGGAPEGWKPS